jgi:hypothetical protein
MLNRNVADAAAQLDRAESEVARVEGQQARVEADYLAAELGAAAYDRLSARLEDEHATAAAERDCLAKHVQDVPDSLLKLDAESETLRRLGPPGHGCCPCRNAAAQGELEALRDLIAAAFEHVFLDPDGTIAWLTPGARLAASAVPLVVGDGGELDAACDGSRASNEVPLTVDDRGHVRPSLDHYAVPFRTPGQPQTIGNDSSRTL